MPAKLHACSCGSCHLPPCKSPFLLIKQLRFLQVHFQVVVSQLWGAEGVTVQEQLWKVHQLRWTPCLRRVSTPEGKIFQVTPVSSKETMKSLKVHRVNSSPKQHRGCCEKQKREWLSGDRQAMCCSAEGVCALSCPSLSASLLFLPSLTSVQHIISLVSEHGRSANEDRWKAIWIVS